ARRTLLTSTRSKARPPARSSSVHAGFISAHWSACRQRPIMLTSEETTRFLRNPLSSPPVLRSEIWLPRWQRTAANALLILSRYVVFGVQQARSGLRLRRNGRLQPDACDSRRQR